MPVSYTKHVDPRRPAVDEWGIYDPAQAGLAAVLELVEARRRSSEPDAKAMAASMRQAKQLTKKPAE
jgi:hypothetical protein